MIDIHSHILPCLDDGAGSMEQSLAMCRIAAEEGIDSVVATPHCYVHHKSASPEKIQECIFAMQKKLNQEGIGITLYAGNEIYYRQDVEEELEQGRVCTLAGSKYVLVEFHPGEEYLYIIRGLNSLSRYGYYPILAHTERYENLFTQKDRLEELKNRGVQIQINASSIAAKGWSNQYRKRALRMIKEEMADFVATDAHSDVHRAPRIRECISILQKKAGRTYTQKLLEENAALILKK